MHDKSPSPPPSPSCFRAPRARRMLRCVGNLFGGGALGGAHGGAAAATATAPVARAAGALPAEVTPVSTLPLGAECADATPEVPPGSANGEPPWEPLMVKGRTLRQAASEDATPFPLSIRVPDYDCDQRPLGQYMSTVNNAMVLESASHYSGRELSPIPGSLDSSMHKRDADGDAPVTRSGFFELTPTVLSRVPSESTALV